MDTRELFNSSQLKKHVPQKEIKMSHSDLAKLFHVTTRTILRWQNGHISFLGYLVMSLLAEKKVTLQDIRHYGELFSRAPLERVFGSDGYDKEGFDAEDFDRDGIKRGYREQVLGRK